MLTAGQRLNTASQTIAGPASSQGVNQRRWVMPMPSWGLGWCGSFPGALFPGAAGRGPAAPPFRRYRV
ncbi:hypothetical protein GCM10018790_55130 [Kitasatospora xanthocidica]|nr:hypothetical protein GCM10018790_55130 [Kitasatospora xanthocidica]